MSYSDDIMNLFIKNPGITFTAEEIAENIGAEKKYIHTYIKRAKKWLADELIVTASQNKADNGHYVQQYTYVPHNPLEEE